MSGYNKSYVDILKAKKVLSSDLIQHSCQVLSGRAKNQINFLPLQITGSSHCTSLQVKVKDVLMYSELIPCFIITYIEKCDGIAHFSSYKSKKTLNSSKKRGSFQNYKNI